jgi:hypothetical protein
LALVLPNVAVQNPAELLTPMRNKYSLLSLAAGAVLLLANGCGKQETIVTPTADKTATSPAPAAVEKPQGVEALKATISQPAAPAKPEVAATINPAVATPAPAIVSATATATVTVAAPPQKPAADQPVAIAPVAAASNTVGTTAAAWKSSSQAGQLSLAQAATNQVQAALGMTNQAALTRTNQVQVLLEQAKSLTTNQKYQEALATLTQLYNTKLTPEQKQQADDLKTQIETALAQKAGAEASSALGNILGGKKQ